jgi:hypothetical protein
MNLKRLCQSKGHSAPPDQSFGAAARETNLPLLSREFDRLSEEILKSRIKASAPHSCHQIRNYYSL